MKDFAGYKRVFHWSTKAWYHRPEFERDVVFGTEHPDGGGFEMAMRWHALGSDAQWSAVPRLEVFTGSWAALATFPDLLQALAEVDGQNVTEAEFCDMLRRCGFEDMTEYTRPGDDVAQAEAATINELAARAIAGILAILADLTDRRGIAHEWRQIEPDIQAEIVQEWRRIIREALDK